MRILLVCTIGVATLTLGAACTTHDDLYESVSEDRMSEWIDWHPSSPLMAWDTSDPETVAGGATNIFVAEVESVEIVESSTMRATVTEDDGSTKEIVEPEGIVSARVSEQIKGNASDAVRIIFPVFMLVKDPETGLPHLPVESGDEYVFSVTGNEKRYLIIPDAGFIPASGGAGVMSRMSPQDSRGESETALNPVERMKMAANNAVPFKDGMPIKEGETVPVDGIRPPNG